MNAKILEYYMILGSYKMPHAPGNFKPLDLASLYRFQINLIKKERKIKMKLKYSGLAILIIFLFITSPAHSSTFPTGSDFVRAYGGVSSQPSQYTGVFQETISDLDEGSLYATASGSLNNKHPYWDNQGGTYGTADDYGNYIQYNGSFSAYASAGSGKIGVFAAAQGSVYNWGLPCIDCHR